MVCAAITPQHRKKQKKITRHYARAGRGRSVCLCIVVVICGRRSWAVTRGHKHRQIFRSPPPPSKSEYTAAVGPPPLPPRNNSDGRRITAAHSRADVNPRIVSAAPPPDFKIARLPGCLSMHAMLCSLKIAIFLFSILFFFISRLSCVLPVCLSVLISPVPCLSPLHHSPTCNATILLPRDLEASQHDLQLPERALRRPRPARHGRARQASSRAYLSPSLHPLPA